MALEGEKMKGLKKTIAVLGIALCPTVMLSVSIQAADGPSTQQQPAFSHQLVDVALSAGGRLSGTVHNGNGIPLANAPVTLIQNQHRIATATADEQGRFAITGVRSGTYVLASGQQSSIYRAWAPGTAPPAARREVQLRVGPVVRGHFGGKIGSHLPSIHPAQYLHNPVTVGGLIGMAVGTPIILHDNEIGS